MSVLVSSWNGFKPVLIILSFTIKLQQDMLVKHCDHLEQHVRNTWNIASNMYDPNWQPISIFTLKVLILILM